MRGIIALSLLGLLAFVVGGALATLWFDLAPFEDLEGFLVIVFGPLIGLVGAVIGFYYGARSSN